MEQLIVILEIISSYEHIYELENLKRINEKISHKYDPVFEMTNEVNLVDRDPKLGRNIFQNKYIKQIKI